MFDVAIRPPGPSPRVRGSLLQLEHPEHRVGSIPACAGKPSPLSRFSRRSRVHPRVCGGRVERPAGPSPRVRGSQRGDGLVQAAHGSIPACAGKPRQRSNRLPAGGVHPRVCGEAARLVDQVSGGTGPSPRVRGSPRARRRRAPRGGSIPACAGKPRRASTGLPVYRVHPRVCGEATNRQEVVMFRKGPSPRVRGSRARLRLGSASGGSIPACAGKPYRDDFLACW